MRVKLLTGGAEVPCPWLLAAVLLLVVLLLRTLKVDTVEHLGEKGEASERWLGLGPRAGSQACLVSARGNSRPPSLLLACFRHQKAARRMYQVLYIKRWMVPELLASSTGVSISSALTGAHSLVFSSGKKGCWKPNGFSVKALAC